MAEITVMLSAAFKAAYLALVPKFESESGHRVSSLWVPTVQIMSRIDSGEVVDIVIMSNAGLDELAARGLVRERTPLARSGIAAAVRAGAPRPDLSSGEALKRAVLAAESIVYSTGPSGVYLAKLFDRMGIADAIAPKLKRVQGEPAGALVARGDAQLGFQQMSELLPVEGIDIVGALSDDVQEITTFSAGLLHSSHQPAAARALVRFFTAPASAAVIRSSGMEPA